MAVFGKPLGVSRLVLTRGRDFKCGLKYADRHGVEQDLPAGDFYFEVYTDPVLTWRFTVSGSRAFVKVEHEVTDTVPDRTGFQLVFLPEGEPAGGDPVALGKVKVQR